MQKLFTALGWVMIAGGLAGGIATYWLVGSQDIFLSLLARLVERPYEYRGYLAAGAACGVALFGILAGLVYLGLGRIMNLQVAGPTR